MAEIVQTKKFLSQEQYDNLYQLFYRTYLTAQLHEAVCSVYYGKRVLASKYGSQASVFRKEINAALKRVEHTAQLMKNMKGTYPIGQFDWGKDAVVALGY